MLTDQELAFYSAWASLLGLAISVFSLLYLRSIHANIVRFRRRQRIRQLTGDILRIPDDATPLSSASRSKLAAFKRNIPVRPWSRWTGGGRVVIEVHRLIDAADLVALKEALHDLSSFSEEP